MYELIDYLSKGPCVVVIGSGPSAEVGLPDWQGLAEEVLTALRLAKPKDLELAEIDFAKNDFPSLLGRAWRGISSDFVLNVCKKALRDSGKKGEAYSFLTSFPFKGYLTTNLEHILARHFADVGIAITALGNSQVDLEQADFDELKCVIQLHGNLENPGYVVLTDQQYDDVVHHPRFAALRLFLSSYLTTARVLFIGYSLSDPDLQFMLKQVCYKLRRKVPLYAIIPNVSDAVADDWDRKYNIRIVRYHASRRNHRELIHLLGVISRYVALQDEAQPEIPSLKIAQSLYMWHRFQATRNMDARVDAFKSLALTALSSLNKPVAKPELIDAVAALASMKSDRVASSISAAVDSAIKEGLIETPTAQTFKLSTTGIALENKYSKQFDALKAEFSQQVRIDLSKALSAISKREIELVVDAVLDALVVCFAERGSEIVEMVFTSEADRRTHLTLLKEINIIAAKLPESCRYFFISYVTQLLTGPTGVQERFLEYLAKAYFAVNALGLDPDGELIRKSLIEGHSLVLDSNVLIPILTIGSANNAFFLEVLQKARSAGIRLWITPRFIDEALTHFLWAGELVRQFGDQSVAVLAASMGRGQYRRNECLDGFVRYMAEAHGGTFDEYLERCIGSPDFKGVKDKAAELGIGFLPMATLTKDNAEFYVVRDQSEEFINTSAASTPDFYKSEARMRAEAEVYAVIYSWDRLKPQATRPEEWRCSFLSRGTFLNRIALKGPFRLNRNLTVRPDLLYEFLCRFEGNGNLRIPLKELLLATYFRSANYFIDKEKYANFFSPLLRKTEKTYTDNFESFRRLVNSDLQPDYLQGEEELERPFVLESLDAEAKDVLRQEVHRLEDQNLELRSAKEAAEKEIAKLKEQIKRKK